MPHSLCVTALVLVLSVCWFTYKCKTLHPCFRAIEELKKRIPDLDNLVFKAREDLQRAKQAEGELSEKVIEPWHAKTALLKSCGRAHPSFGMTPTFQNLTLLIS